MIKKQVSEPVDLRFIELSFGLRLRRAKSIATRRTDTLRSPAVFASSAPPFATRFANRVTLRALQLVPNLDQHATANRTSRATRRLISLGRILRSFVLNLFHHQSRIQISYLKFCNWFCAHGPNFSRAIFTLCRMSTGNAG